MTEDWVALLAVAVLGQAAVLGIVVWFLDRAELLTGGVEPRRRKKRPTHR